MNKALLQCGGMAGILAQSGVEEKITELVVYNQESSLVIQIGM